MICGEPQATSYFHLISDRSGQSGKMPNQVETFRPQTSRAPRHGNTLRSLLSLVQPPSCAFSFSRLLSWPDPLNLASGFLAKDWPHQGQAHAEGLAGAIQSIRTHAAGEEQVQQTLAGTVQSLPRQSRRNLFSKVRDKQGKGREEEEAGEQRHWSVHAGATESTCLQYCVAAKTIYCDTELRIPLFW